MEERAAATWGRMRGERDGTGQEETSAGQTRAPPHSKKVPVATGCSGVGRCGAGWGGAARGALGRDARTVKSVRAMKMTEVMAKASTTRADMPRAAYLCGGGSGAQAAGYRRGLCRRAEWHRDGGARRGVSGGTPRQLGAVGGEASGGWGAHGARGANHPRHEEREDSEQEQVVRVGLPVAHQGDERDEDADEGGGERPRA